MLELYHGNLSVAGAHEVTRQLWEEKISFSLIWESNQKIATSIQAWLHRKITEPQLYVFFHAIDVKQKIHGENQSTRLIAALGVNKKGIRQILAVMSGRESDAGLWKRFFADLARRGLRGTKLFIGENDGAARAAVATCFPAALYQGCLLQLEREVTAKVRPNLVFDLQKGFKELRASDTTEEALQMAEVLAVKIRNGQDREAAELLDESIGFQFNYLHFPEVHRSRLRTTEPLRRILREFRETIRLIGPVQDDSALTSMLAARLRREVTTSRS